MKILIVEDDVLLAGFLEGELLDQGHQVCGIAPNVDAAVALVRLHRPDLALVDMQLSRGELGTAVTNRLAASGDLARMGVLYVTGSAERVRREARFGHAYMLKPYGMSALSAALAIVRDLADHGSTSRPLPHGMELLAAHPGGEPRAAA